MARGLMDNHDRQRSPEIRADDLESLNNLLASLLKSGLPLESGLKAVASEWPGHAGCVLRQLTERLSQGESLESALTYFSDSLPVEYVSLVRAGQRTGRLGQILNDLARLARLREETRQVAVVAMIYPLIVACFAVVLGLFLLRNCIPLIQEVMIDGSLPQPGILQTLSSFGVKLQQVLTPSRILAGIVGGFCLSMILAWRFGHFAEKFAERLPVLGRAWRDWRTAHWAELMAMLLENETPEPEALELSAVAYYDRKLAERLTALATHIRSGHRPNYEDWRGCGLPAVAIWAMNWSGPLENRVSSLRMMAASYSNNARHRMALSFSVIPLIMLVTIGGLFTLFYGLLLFLPITSLYRSLT